MRRLVALTVASALTACTVGPDYRQPDIATPPMFGELPAAAQPVSTPVANEADLTKWWTQFHDPELERLVDLALKQNLDLLTAASRIRGAREQEAIAGAAEFPTLNATGSALKLHSNSNPLSAFTGGGGSQQGGTMGMSGMLGMNGQSGGTDVNFYSAGFDATWEIDVFGGVRRGVEAARANTEAALWALRDGEVSLTAEVARDYLDLRAAQSRAAIIRNELTRQQDTLGIVKARAETGFVTELDVNQQTAEIASTEAEVPPLEAQARADIHALGVLLGMQPEALAKELSPMGTTPQVPATLPVGLPSDLLRRRPDIREAERKLAAATAQVGMAVAQLYPTFNLLGLASLGSTAVGNLFSAKNFTGAALGMFSWPIFNAGKTRANVGATEEQQTQAYLAYRKSILGALQDVEDALARYTSEQQRLISLRKAQAAAQSSYTIARQQYVTGLVNNLTVLNAETTLLTTEDQIAQSEAQLAENLVALYKALGGGWQDNDPERTYAVALPAGLSGPKP